MNKEVPELLSRAAHEFILKAGVVVMNLWRTAASACLLVLMIGCTDTDGAGTDPGVASESLPAGSDSEPPVEPTEPEETQSTLRRPSIELASAPIGGNVQADGANQCAEVNWLGTNPIPDGTIISIGTPHLEPGGVFELNQSACAEELRPCPSVQWQGGNFNACYVGVRQVANSDTTIQLIMPVSATCATEEDCKSLEGDKSGSQISFRPGPPSG
ncbi:hypothetical protein GCM10009789_60370 [Kribbella sancticallisti]|uniref:LppP/LprE lipoprotein n=1 Tax=Kribbella sancticallisti TaxID=460087 RepID=A0ABN2E6T6_9ACTN